MEENIQAYITKKERFYASLYNTAMRRYHMLDKAVAIPLMAVRLYTLRTTFDGFLDRLVRNGTAWVAERCRREMGFRQEYMAHMMAKFPPKDASEGEGAIEEMAQDLAIMDSPRPKLFLILYLDRLRERELRMRGKPQRKPTVH